MVLILTVIEIHKSYQMCIIKFNLIITDIYIYGRNTWIKRRLIEYMQNENVTS